MSMNLTRVQLRCRVLVAAAGVLTTSFSGGNAVGADLRSAAHAPPPVQAPASPPSLAVPVDAVAPLLKKPRPGTFGHLFNLPPFAPPSAALNDLGSPAGPMFDLGAPENDNPERQPSGFQFLDHDMTLDRHPLTDEPVPLDQLINVREPNLSLDSVYGGGPQANPELYDGAGRFIIGSGGRDLQRRPDGTAVLVEGRNDENMIVAQIHVALQRFHNAMRDRGHNFTNARNQTILHYQWVILNDYLPRVVGQAMVTAALHGDLGIYDVNNPNKKVMPVEFSVAAFRFGHSQVRAGYGLNGDPNSGALLFSPGGADLRVTGQQRNQQ